MGIIGPLIVILIAWGAKFIWEKKAKDNVEQIEKKIVNEELAIQIINPGLPAGDKDVIKLDLIFSNGGEGAHSITSVKTLHSLYPTFKTPEKSREQLLKDKNIEFNRAISLSSLLNVVVKSGEIVQKKIQISSLNPLETSPPKKLNYFIGLEINIVDSHGERHTGEYLIFDVVYANNPYNHGDSFFGNFQTNNNQLSFLFRGGKYNLLGGENKSVTPNPVISKLFRIPSIAVKVKEDPISAKDSTKDSNTPAK